MRNPFKAYPQLSRLILGAILIPGAMIVSGIIPIPIPHFHEYFPFLGVILVIAVTALLYRNEGKNLSELGLDLRPRNLLFLPLGLLLGIACFAIGQYATTTITHFHYHLNPNIAYTTIGKLLYAILPAAAIQELVVRGYCFKKLIDITNTPIAILITGLIFIAMHDVFGGNIGNDILFAAIIFLGHLWFAESLLKSGAIYLPIGLHWGNNFATQTLFMNNPQPTAIFYTSDPPLTSLGWPGLIAIFLLANIGFIIMLVILMRRPTHNVESIR